MSYGDEWRGAARTRDAGTAVGRTDERPGQRPPPGMTQAVQQDTEPTARSGRGGSSGGSSGSSSGGGSGGRRRAKLAIRRLDPWSVMKFSLVFSIVLCVVLIVAVAILYFLLSGMGVFDSINGTISSFQVRSKPVFTAKGVIGITTLIGLADIFLLTAIATLGAFAYNLCADLVGGIEVTLAEHE